MTVGLLTLHLHFPGCKSLKEKRGRLRPLIVRLQKDFNLSVAEMLYQDVWQSSVIACAMVSNDRSFTERALFRVSDWVHESWPDVTLVEEQVEIY